jgi:hypothetical protein
MLIGLGSVKGSPGVTTLASALAARWPDGGPRPVVVELDPAGGDVGSRWQAHDEPGLVGMAVAAQSGPLGDAAGWVQHLSVGMDVIVAPCGDAAAATVADLAARSRDTLRELAGLRPVLADLGRLDPLSPALSFLDIADELLLLARFRLDGLRHLRPRIEALTKRCPVRLVLVGRNDIALGEVSDYLGVPLAAVVPDDHAGADILAGRARRSMGWTRRPLLTAARSIALSYAGTATTTRPALAHTADVVGVNP